MLKRMRLIRLLAASFLLGQGFVCTEALAIFASPVNGGCYIAAVGQCKIHVEPVTINVASGKSLLFYQFVLTGGGRNTVIYQFKTDLSNPPLNNYSPSIVMQDFAATCGATYSISLQGQDSGDANAFNLGLTQPITCPTTAP